MLHKMKNGEILEGLPELKALLPPFVRKKQLLLEMARRGEPRPKQKTKIGQALSSYATKSSKCYDPAFFKEVKRLAPEWLVSKSQIAEQKKKELLLMAKKGEQRPNRKHPLSHVLSHATSRKSEVHDPEFTKEITKLAPHWFVSKSQIAEKKKKQLLDMAARGEPRPNRNHPVGRVLPKYTSKKSASYDPAFTKKIYKLVPHWFASLTERAVNKKRQLLEMARRGEPRPKQKTKIGQALSSYATKSSKCYDPAFFKEVKRLAPYWFKKCSTR